MTETKYALELFPYSEDAIEFLCDGCPDERGWTYMEHPIEPVCRHMVDDLSRMPHEGAKPIVMEFQGRPFCAVRYEKYVKAEHEKYERRMRGDWS